MRIRKIDPVRVVSKTVDQFYAVADTLDLVYPYIGHERVQQNENYANWIEDLEVTKRTLSKFIQLLKSHQGATQHEK
jgi:hypothetical protein